MRLLLLLFFPILILNSRAAIEYDIAVVNATAVPFEFISLRFDNGPKGLRLGVLSSGATKCHSPFDLPIARSVEIHCEFEDPATRALQEKDISVPFSTSSVPAQKERFYLAVVVAESEVRFEYGLELNRRTLVASVPLSQSQRFPRQAGKMNTEQKQVSVANQAADTTPVAVTPAAAASVAPAIGRGSS